MQPVYECKLRWRLGWEWLLYALFFFTVVLITSRWHAFSLVWLIFAIGTVLYFLYSIFTEPSAVYFYEDEVVICYGFFKTIKHRIMNSEVTRICDASGWDLIERHTWAPSRSQRFTTRNDESVLGLETADGRYLVECHDPQDAFRKIEHLFEKGVIDKAVSVFPDRTLRIESESHNGPQDTSESTGTGEHLLVRKPSEKVAIENGPIHVIEQKSPRNVFWLRSGMIALMYSSIFTNISCRTLDISAEGMTWTYADYPELISVFLLTFIIIFIGTLTYYHFFNSSIKLTILSDRINLLTYSGPVKMYNLDLNLNDLESIRTAQLDARLDFNPYAYGKEVKGKWRGWISFPVISDNRGLAFSTKRGNVVVPLNNPVDVLDQVRDALLKLPNVELVNEINPASS